MEIIITFNLEKFQWSKVIAEIKCVLVKVTQSSDMYVDDVRSTQLAKKQVFVSSVDSLDSSLISSSKQYVILDFFFLVNRKRVVLQSKYVFS